MQIWNKDVAFAFFSIVDKQVIPLRDKKKKKVDRLSTKIDLPNVPLTFAIFRIPTF